MTTLRELRFRGRAEATEERINPRDVDLLLADAAGHDPVWLLAHDDQTATGEVESRFRADFRRRMSGEPLQYIRRKSEFFGREFRVDSRVLIPRPETEQLVEAAIRFAPHGGRIVDVGTGSGCVAVSIALERPDLHVFATDTSFGALLVARCNRDRLSARVNLAAMSVLDGTRRSFQAVVSNPPYIPSADVDGLQTEVRDHEPRQALTPGIDGLRIIRGLLQESQRLLTEGGVLALEIGFGQSEAVREIADAAGWKRLTILDDFAAIPRIAILFR